MNGELSRQQKIWKMTALLIRSFRPAILYLFLPSVLMGLGMLVGGKRTADDITSQSGSFYYAAGSLICLWLFFKRRGESLRKEIVCTFPFREGWIRIFLLCAVGFLFSLSVSALLTLLPQISFVWGNYTASTSSAFSGYDRLLTVLTNIILAPVMEETVFRGYMMGRLKKELTAKQAVLISTAFFAVCHVEPIWMLYAFGMGLLLAWVSLREGNIFYSMALHIGFNLASLPVSMINGWETGRQLLFGSWWKIALIGTAAAAAALYAFSRYRKEREKR